MRGITLLVALGATVFFIYDMHLVLYRLLVMAGSSRLHSVPYTTTTSCHFLRNFLVRLGRVSMTVSFLHLLTIV